MGKNDGGGPCGPERSFKPQPWPRMWDAADTLLIVVLTMAGSLFAGAIGGASEGTAWGAICVLLWWIVMALIALGVRIKQIRDQVFYLRQTQQESLELQKKSAISSAGHPAGPGRPPSAPPAEPDSPLRGGFPPTISLGRPQRP